MTGVVPYVMLGQSVGNTPTVRHTAGGAHVDAPVRGDPAVASGEDPHRDRARRALLARMSEQRPRPAAVRGTRELAGRRARPAARLRPRDRARARPSPRRRPRLAVAGNRLDPDKA